MLELVQVLAVYVVMVTAIVVARRALSSRRVLSTVVTVLLYSVGVGLTVTVFPGGIDAPTHRVGVFVMTGLAMMAVWPFLPVGRSRELPKS